MKENNSFAWGLRDGIAIGVGYLAVSFAFGISAVLLGLSVLEAVLISLLNLTSAGQLAAVPIIAGMGSVIELIVAELVINSRYALMSVSLSQSMGHSVRLRDRFLIAFANTDEIFAVAVGKGEPVGRKYMLGLATTPYFGWTLGTLFGALAGNILPEILISALGIAIYGMFVAIVVPAAIASRSTALCVALSIALSFVFNYVTPLNKISGGFIIIICAVTVSLLLALVAPIPDEEVATDA
jgi:predicted branched-subunit amino acid permease